MSNQTYASPGDPYWLSSRGVNSVSFNKLSSPPLSYLDKGIMYEMDDGQLYYNGEVIVTGPVGSPIVTGPVTSTVGALPIWGVTTGDEITDSEVFAVGVAATKNVALSSALVPSLAGATNLVSIGYHAGGTLPAADNVTAVGCQALESAVGGAQNDNVAIGYKAGQNVTADCYNAVIIGSGAGKVCQAQDVILIGKDCAIEATLATGSDGCIVIGEESAYSCTDLSNSVVIGSYSYLGPTCKNTTIVGFGVCALTGTVTIDHSVLIGESCFRYASGLVDNTVAIGSAIGVTASMVSTDRSVLIGHNCASFLTTGSGNTFVGDDSGNRITTGSDNIAVGSEAGRVNTTGSNNIHIGNIGAIESDTIRIGTLQTRAFLSGVRGVSVTSGLPVVVDSAGQLGTGLLNKFSAGGQAILDGGNANILGGVQSATLYDAGNAYANVAPFAINLTTFRFKFFRALSLLEDINVRLVVNGTPVASLSTGVWGATFVPATPTSGTADAFSVTLAAGDQWYILVNSFTATTPDNYLQWSLA